MSTFQIEMTCLIYLNILSNGYNKLITCINSCNSLASVKPANLSTDNVSPVAMQESLVTLLMPTVIY